MWSMELHRLGKEVFIVWRNSSVMLSDIFTQGPYMAAWTRVFNTMFPRMLWKWLFALDPERWRFCAISLSTKPCAISITISKSETSHRGSHHHRSQNRPVLSQWWGRLMFHYLYLRDIITQKTITAGKHHADLFHYCIQSDQIRCFPLSDNRTHCRLHSLLR